METKLTIKSQGKVKLSAILSEPNDLKESIVILAHGFTSNKNSSTNIEITNKLNQHNVATLRFDFFGHGESEGKFENITISKGVENILSIIEYLKNLGYVKIGLIGSSFGGQTSLVAASKSKDLNFLVAKCPVSDYQEVERLRKSEEDIKNWEKIGFVTHINSKGKKFKLNYEFWKDAHDNIVYYVTDKIDIPTLIIHGDTDQIVPVEQSRKTSKLIENCTYIEMPGADHLFSNEKNFIKMIDLVSSFAARQISN